MEIKGEFQISSSREVVWAALNDADVLKRCIPGCESLQQISDTEFSAQVISVIGPVKARFTTKISLQDLNPPESYTLVGYSKAGVAGFGRGSARVSLISRDGGTLLRYVADFQVGGKLAQVGSRLVLGATRKVANEFFRAFSTELDPAALRLDDTAPAGKTRMPRKAGLLIGAAIAMLLLAWFLLR